MLGDRDLLARLDLGEQLGEALVGLARGHGLHGPAPL
jgi:hypothetical protein